MAKVYRWSIKMVDRGVACIGSVHYQTDVPLAGSEPSPADVLTQIDQHYSSSGTNLVYWTNVLQSGAQVVETRVYEEVEDPDATPPTGAIAGHSLAGTGGALTTDAPPVEMCGYISLTTEKLGRSFRGGCHTPPIPSSAALGPAGLLDHASSWYGNVVTLRDKMVDQLEDVFGTTGDINPVIYSRTRRKAGHSDFATKVTDGRVNEQFRWLRRRATAP